MRIWISAVWRSGPLAAHGLSPAASFCELPGRELLRAQGLAETDEVLTLRVARQSKTANPAMVPWSNPLPGYAAAWAAERETVKAALACLSGGFTFLEANGRVRSSRALAM